MRFKDDEILQLYREAKDKSNEIKILSELNAVPVKEIRAFLIEHGYEVPEDKRFKNEKPVKVKPKVAAVSPEIKSQPLDIPGPIREILQDKQKEYLNTIYKLERDVKEIDKFLGTT